MGRRCGRHRGEKAFPCSERAKRFKCADESKVLAYTSLKDGKKGGRTCTCTRAGRSGRHRDHKGDNGRPSVLAAGIYTSKPIIKARGNVLFFLWWRWPASVMAESTIRKAPN